MNWILFCVYYNVLNENMDFVTEFNDKIHSNFHQKHSKTQFKWQSNSNTDCYLLIDNDL